MPAQKRKPSPSEGTTEEAPVRYRERIPFSGLSKKLDVAYKDPEFYYYWQKDTGDNIARMLRAGYEFVDPQTAKMQVPEMLTSTDVNPRTDVDGALRVHGGVGEGGRDYGLVLMRIPMKLHEEDMQDHETRNLAIDSAIHRQAFGGGKHTLDEETSYGNINVTVKHEE